MGAGQSRNRNPQYPMPQPQMIPGMYGPPPPPTLVPYGYGQPVYPGVVPQMAQFGQSYVQMQPPPLNYVPQDKYNFKRSRRRESERYVGGFSSGGQPESSSHRRRSESQPQFPIPQLNQASASFSASHRAPTPFIPAYGREFSPEDEDDVEDGDDDDNYGEDYGEPRRHHRRSSSRRETSQYPSSLPVFPEPNHVFNPLERASSAAYGPRPRPPVFVENKLPAPPRDLYEHSPYKSILNLPQTTALLTATYSQQEPLTVTVDTAGKPKKSGLSGILRTFSRKGKQKAAGGQKVLFVPVQMPTSAARVDTTQNLGAGAGGSSTTPTTPVPPIPSSPPTIRFDQIGKYAMFMNHSPHRVVWTNNLTYPTALHLHEALKFMETRPDIAEQIRACERPEDVYPLSASVQQFQRSDWGTIFLDLMKEVMYQKFRQHPDLRTTLLMTGTARLVYADGEDSYWGTGADGTGQNQLGKNLVVVRDRLMSEAM